MTTMGLGGLVASLYSEKPSCTLYHYTSLGALLNIVPTKAIRATEIRYFSDFAEGRHGAELLAIAIDHERTMGRLPTDPFSVRLFSQFLTWLHYLLNGGPRVFAACFTPKGNLLSQWRGYCPPAKGVSLGFAPDPLCAAAESQRPTFRVGKCIYERDKQLDIVTAIISGVSELARTKGEDTKAQPIWSFTHIFREIENDLLHVVALLKDNSFHEEEEWRFVSVVERHEDAPIRYREGTSTLVPFVDFKLPMAAPGGPDLDRVIIGPTPHVDNSKSAIESFLSKSGTPSENKVWYCEIPYRTW